MVLFQESVLSVPFTVTNRLFDLFVQFVQFVQSDGLLSHLAPPPRLQMEPFFTP